MKVVRSQVGVLLNLEGVVNGTTKVRELKGAKHE